MSQCRLFFIPIGTIAPGVPLKDSVIPNVGSDGNPGKIEYCDSIWEKSSFYSYPEKAKFQFFRMSPGGTGSHSRNVVIRVPVSQSGKAPSADTCLFHRASQIFSLQ
jgi:hypothetical protein